MPDTYPFFYFANVNSFEFFSSTNNGVINILVANVSYVFITTSLKQIHRSGVNGSRGMNIFKTIDTYTKQFSCIL